MKVKEFFYLLGLKPKPRTFGVTIETHNLPREGLIEVAQWQHHRANRIAPTQAVVDQLRRFLRPGDTVLDIGAHAGDTAIPMALAVGPTGTVLAFEPNPYVFPVLARNASLNADKTHILAYQYAAMRADGQYQFHYGEPGYCNGGYHEGMSAWRHASAFTVNVEGRNLDEFLQRSHPDLVNRLRFIKVDTEGFDLAVLETLEDLLYKTRPILQVEMFNLKRAPSGYRERLHAFLVQHDYQVFRIIGEDNYFGDRITDANLMHWQGYDVCCVSTESVAGIAGI